MKTRPRLVLNRRAWIAACCIAALPILLTTAGSTTEAAVGPDVVVFTLSGVGNYGVSGGYAGYSVGTTSCNRGDAPLNWVGGSQNHPVIAQNLYRLKSGRFEQIGMSWLKHGFTSVNSTTLGCTGVAGQSCQGGGGSQLGVGCTDPYGSGLNGSRPLGPRSEVNATTGIFPYPYTQFSASTTYEQRVKVATTDVDPALNSGAAYWVEGQYISNDDAGAGNALNNASYRPVTVGAAPSFNITVAAGLPTIERQPAIYAWKTQDPTVTLINADVPGSIVERFHVGRKVTDLGGGVWHYEFAVHNLNSDRSARAFSVQFPAAANITNAGFKDIEAHSGEPYSGTDWTVSNSGGQISWSTDTFANDQNANALRWATLFNFWFDADQPPTDTVVHTIELFKPGTPASVAFTIGDGLFLDSFESGNTSSWTGVRTN